MANRVLELVEERAEEIAATATSSEQLGRLDDRAVKALRECGVMKMLQPARYGGTDRAETSSRSRPDRVVLTSRSSRPSSRRRRR